MEKTVKKPTDKKVVKPVVKKDAKKADKPFVNKAKNIKDVPGIGKSQVIVLTEKDFEKPTFEEMKEISKMFSDAPVLENNVPETEIVDEFAQPLKEEQPTPEQLQEAEEAIDNASAELNPKYITHTYEPSNDSALGKVTYSDGSIELMTQEKYDKLPQLLEKFIPPATPIEPAVTEPAKPFVPVTHTKHAIPNSNMIQVRYSDGSTENLSPQAYNRKDFSVYEKGSE